MIHPLAALVRLHEMRTLADDASAPRPAEISRLLQAITPQMHQRYVGSLKKFGESAVSPMHRGVCTGCYVRQPAALQQVEEGIYECQSCGRLIYDEDEAYEMSVG